MAVWFSDSHADHIPTRLAMWSRWPQTKHTAFRLQSAEWGRQPVRRRRIGSVDTQKRSFLDGITRPKRVISECGNTNNPRPLADTACLNQTNDQNFSEHLTYHCSFHPTGQQLELSSSGSPQDGRLTVTTMKLPEHACVCTLRWSLTLGGGALHPYAGA